MAKYVKTYHEGLTKDSVEVMTVYRLTVTYSYTHTKYPGEVHQDYFMYNEGLLYSYLTDALGDMSGIDSIKVEKI